MATIIAKLWIQMVLHHMTVLWDWEQKRTKNIIWAIRVAKVLAISISICFILVAALECISEDVKSICRMLTGLSLYARISILLGTCGECRYILVMNGRVAPLVLIADTGKPCEGNCRLNQVTCMQIQVFWTPWLCVCYVFVVWNSDCVVPSLCGVYE